MIFQSEPIRVIRGARLKGRDRWAFAALAVTIQSNAEIRMKTANTWQCVGPVLAPGLFPWQTGPPPTFAEASADRQAVALRPIAWTGLSEVGSSHPAEHMQAPRGVLGGSRCSKDPRSKLRGFMPKGNKMGESRHKQFIREYYILLEPSRVDEIHSRRFCQFQR